MSKRYVLLKSDSEMDEGDFRELGEYLAKNLAGAKLILLEGNNGFAVVKTNQKGASMLRAGGVKLRSKSLKTELTSGSIGNLKRRASVEGTTGLGEVPE